MLHGPVQTSYRAEVRALLHVVQTAAAPVFVMIDCKGVANTFNDFLKGKRDMLHMREQDLWDLVFKLAEAAPVDHFQVQWMPSHLDDEINNFAGFRMVDLDCNFFTNIHTIE